MDERIIKCDICGKQINSHHIFYKYFKVGWGGEDYSHRKIEYDLCDECWKKMHDYFNKLKGENK